MHTPDVHSKKGINMKGLGVIGLSSVVLALTVSGCSSASSGGSGSSSPGGRAGASGPLHVLWVAGTSGPTGPYGIADIDGTMAGIAYVNATGGIDGHKLELTSVKTDATPSTDVSALIQHLTSGTSYILTIPGASSGEIAATIPATKGYQTVTMVESDGNSQCKTNTSSSCPNAYALLGSADSPESDAAAFFKQKGIGSVGILQEAIDFTQTETPLYKAALAQAGIRSTTVSFPATATNLSPEMSELQNDKVEAVLVEAEGTSPGYALAARATLGLNVPVVVDLAGSSLDITTEAPPADLANAYVNTFAIDDPAANFPGLALFAKYAPAGTLSSIPANAAVGAWDKVLLIRDAVQRAKGATTATAIEKVLDTSAAKPFCDPNFLFAHCYAFTTGNHENAAEAGKDFIVMPVGPIREGQVQPSK
jgi:ABC-type branched-subunit amino acid transport system substrate-binding protein